MDLHALKLQKTADRAGYKCMAAAIVSVGAMIIYFGFISPDAIGLLLSLVACLCCGVTAAHAGVSAGADLASKE